METGNGGSDARPIEPRTSVSMHSRQQDAIKMVRDLGEQGKIFVAEILWNEQHEDWLVRVDYERKV